MATSRPLSEVDQIRIRKALREAVEKAADLSKPARGAWVKQQLVKSLRKVIRGWSTRSALHRDWTRSCNSGGVRFPHLPPTSCV
jgi:hypothetical protein